MTIRARQPKRVKAITPQGNTWEREVTDALNTLPALSTFSYDDPNNFVAATPGTMGSNVKDGATSLWVKTSGDTETGWQSLCTTGVYDQVSEISTRLAQRAYGGLRFGIASSSSDRISGIATGASQWTAWEIENPGLNMDSNVTAGYVTIEIAGTYWLGFTSSFSGTANTEFDSHLLVNGVENYSIGFHRKLGTGGDVGSAAWGGMLVCASGDTLCPSVEVDSGSGTFIGVYNASFMLTLLEAS